MTPIRNFLVLVLFGTLSGTKPVLGVNCKYPQSILSAHRQCFSREGITIDIPTNLDPLKIADFMQKAASLGNPEKACSNAEAYKRIIVCVNGITRECLQPLNLSQYLPSDKQMMDSLDYICQNVKDYNYQCASSNINATFECASKRMADYAGSNPGLTQKDMMCKAFEFQYQCTEEHVGACDPKTFKIHMTATRLQTPEICAHVIPNSASKSHKSIALFFLTITGVAMTLR